MCIRDRQQVSVDHVERHERQPAGLTAQPHQHSVGRDQAHPHLNDRLPSKQAADSHNGQPFSHMPVFIIFVITTLAIHHSLSLSSTSGRSKVNSCHHRLLTLWLFFSDFFCSLVFMSLPPRTGGEDIMFCGRPSVRPSVRRCLIARCASVNTLYFISLHYLFTYLLERFQYSQVFSRWVDIVEQVFKATVNVYTCECCNGGGIHFNDESSRLNRQALYSHYFAKTRVIRQ